MIADTQIHRHTHTNTHRQTDTLVTMLHSSIGEDNSKHLCKE